MAEIDDQTAKVSRSRERMRAKGLRPVQFWVPDTRAPAFIADLQRQCAALRGDPAESDVLKFSDDAAGKVEGWA